MDTPEVDQTTQDYTIDQTQPAIDPAEVEALRQRAAAAEQQANALQQQQWQTQMAQQAIAHEIQRRKVIEDADGDVDKIVQYYEQQRASEQQQMQAGMQQLLVNGYRTKLTQEYGIRPDQVILLGEDPNMMEQRAQLLAQQNTQAAQFQQSLNTAFVGQQAHDRVVSNADRIGGSRGGAGTTAPSYTKGSTEHLHSLLFGDV